MSEFKKLIKEIRKTLQRILLFDILLESILVYLAVYFVLMIFNFYQKYSIIAAIIYFGVMFYRRRNVASISTVEKRYPSLQQALTTANDTIDEDNYVVKQLRNIVKTKIKKVSASTFLDVGKDATKILGIIIMMFAILSLSVCQGTSKTCQKVFDTIDVQKAAQKIDVKDFLLTLKKNTIDNVDMNTFHRNKDSNIETENLLLDSNSIAKLGNDKMKINIKLANDQIDIHDVDDNVQEKEFMDMDIESIGITGDANFEENIKKENKDIVRNYFDTINR